MLTFGTETEVAASVSSAGTAAVTVMKNSGDLYLVPLDSRSGQTTGVTRRLTQDGRLKYLAAVGGEPRNAYFFASSSIGEGTRDCNALDLNSGAQALLVPKLDSTVGLAVSRDGRQIAYSVPEGDSYSIRVGDAGADPSTARQLCRSCGLVRRFSPDGRFLLYSPEVQPKPNGLKRTIRLREVASGNDRPWMEHPTESVTTAGFDEDGARLAIAVYPAGSAQTSKAYLVPWREGRCR
jgi:hypothetical protein